MSKEIIKLSEDYEEKKNRNGNVNAQIDELMDDLLNQVRKTINIDDKEMRDLALISIYNYLAGYQDGLRFNRPNPYGPDNPQVNPGGSRISIPERV